MTPKTFITGAIVGFMALNYLLKSDKMTKEEQIEEFGMEIPDKYLGYIKGRNWTKEYIEKVIKIAENYNSDEEKVQ